VAPNFCNETRSKRIKYTSQGSEMTAKSLIALAAAAMLGCASTPEDDSVIVKNDAVEDYIKVAELKEIDAIRKRGELHHTVVSEHYIILKDQRNAYLATFRQRCQELDRTEVRPDIRHDLNVLRARFDTFRGCRIQHLYEITEGQATELLELGERSGK
jgi:uncharacterized lipoprotein YajG